METIEDRSVELLPWHRPSVQRLLVTVGTKLEGGSGEDGGDKEIELF